MYFEPNTACLLKHIYSHNLPLSNPLTKPLSLVETYQVSAANSVDSIDEKLIELQQELVKKTNSKETYDEIAKQIFELRKQRQQAAMDTVQLDEQISHITDLQDFIKARTSDLTEFDKAPVKR